MAAVFGWRTQRKGETKGLSWGRDSYLFGFLGSQAVSSRLENLFLGGKESPGPVSPKLPLKNGTPLCRAHRIVIMAELPLTMMGRSPVSMGPPLVLL